MLQSKVEQIINDMNALEVNSHNAHDIYHLYKEYLILSQNAGNQSNTATQNYQPQKPLNYNPIPFFNDQITPMARPSSHQKGFSQEAFNIGLLMSHLVFLSRNNFTQLITIESEHAEKIKVMWNVISQKNHQHCLLVPDYEAPSQEDFYQFKAIVDEQFNHGNKIAVHCKAGCGRTSTFIIAYMMLNHQYTYKDALRKYQSFTGTAPEKPTQHEALIALEKTVIES